jgi:hypothetical protein
MNKPCVRSGVLTVCAAVGVVGFVEVAACGKTETAMKTLGATCGASSECTTGKCVDQVCCNTTCDGGCERCDYQPYIGSCTAVPGGQDPDSDCDDQGAATCGKNGSCNGNRACAYYSSSYVCVNATCAGDYPQYGRSCDGVGACAPGADAGWSLGCFPFTCDPGVAACYATCDLDAGTASCSTNAVCVTVDGGAACKGQASATCTSNGQCLSGTCDGGGSYSGTCQ